MPLETGLATGKRVSAVGDVHGCSGKLSALLDHFCEGSTIWSDNCLVFLGDLHDRGTDGLGSIDLAIDAQKRSFSRIFWLMGNHEQLLRRTLQGEDETARFHWMQNGGGVVLDQLNLVDTPYNSTGRQFAKSLAEALGCRRIDWLCALRSHVQLGNLLFVHAGINHRISLDRHFEQPWHHVDELHWSWIRYEFLERAVSVPNLVVVHGHTPARRRPLQEFVEADFEPHREQGGKINLDGGSFFSGCVIGAEFVASAWRLAAAIGPPSS